jgi:hypothetical protein
MALGKHGFALTPLTADKTTRLQRNAQYKKVSNFCFGGVPFVLSGLSEV